MTLYVDRREETKSFGAPPLIPYLQRHITPRSLVELVELSSADAAHPILLPGDRLGMAGYEIKHVADVLDCMEDGRLTGVDGQLEHMVEDYDVRWIVLEDRIEPDEHSGVLMKKLPAIRLARKKGTGRKHNPLRLKHNTKTSSDGGRWVPALYSNARQTRYETLIKFLTVACFGYGVMLWRTGSRDETAQFLAAEYRAWQERWESHTSLRRFNDAVTKRPMIGMTVEQRKRAMLMRAFDDIGFEKGCAVAREYSTMRGLLDALLRGDVDEFAQVVCGGASGRGGSDGRVQRVGKAAAKKLIEQVNGTR